MRAQAKKIIEAETPKAFLKRIGRQEHELRWDDFNPDIELSPADLEPWIKYIEAHGNMFVASLWFPGQPGRKAVVYDLHTYLRHKRLAMELRLQGQIEDARQHEGICDRIYDGLPDYARW